MPAINLSPLTAEQAALDRRRKMAEAMQQQAQLANGDAKRTPGVQTLAHLRGFAKLLQGYMGARAEQKRLPIKRQYEADTMATMLRF
jgi:hypothetical protein